MRGVGRATGAITIVNALFTGVGCAAAVDLPLDVAVELMPGTPSDARAARSGRGADLATTFLEEALRAFPGGSGHSARLEIRSTIPAGRGLKSSSALGVAIIRATAAALGTTVSDLDAARLCARAARLHGASATGAFDDAMAAAAGGIVLTDNATDAVLQQSAFPPDWVVVLDVGEREHRPPREYRDQFAAHATDGELAVASARRGDWAEAMDRNSAAVERALGLEGALRRRSAQRSGAIASGLSGMGPSFAAILPRGRLAAFLGAFPITDERRRVVEFSRAGSRGPG
jgi:shikimate kinase